MAEEKVREVKPMRPGGRGGARGPMPKVENPGKIFKRLLGYVFANYLYSFILANDTSWDLVYAVTY